MSSEKDFLPLGFSRTEGGGSSLSAVNGDSICPNCSEGYLSPPSSTSGSWGSPDSPASVYCRKCNTKFILGLREE